MGAVGTTDIAVLGIVVDSTTRGQDVRISLRVEAGLLQGNDALADLLFPSKSTTPSSTMLNRHRIDGILRSARFEGYEEDVSDSHVVS